MGKVSTYLDFRVSMWNYWKDSEEDLAVKTQGAKWKKTDSYKQVNQVMTIFQF